jgi:hypothetical protein
LAVFVLDKRKKPLVRCSKKRARLLLTRGRALVHRHYPLTIRLKDRTGGEVRPLLVKIDPGSKTFIQRADGYGFAVPTSPVAAFGRTAFHPHLPATVASGGF